jgi:hypothetical protein
MKTTLVRVSLFLLSGLFLVGCHQGATDDPAAAAYKGPGPAKAGAPSATPGGGGGVAPAQEKPSSTGPKLLSK